MLSVRDNLESSLRTFRAHRLRALLTMLGLTMGVATLITVMTIVQGANLYVEQKIANLGTNVFQIGRLPFAVTDFNLVIKARKHKIFERADVRAIAEGCPACQAVGATASSTAKARRGDKEVQDVNFVGQTANMAEIDTRAVEQGRPFTEAEESHSVHVCLIGDTLSQQLFSAATPIGKSLRVNNEEFTVVGVLEKVGSVLGQDQDNFVIVPLSVFQRMQGTRGSLIINVKAEGGEKIFEIAQDQARLVVRARRHIAAGAEEDFYFGTKESYMSLWRTISSAFFSVFILVSAISSVVGGIVIMNVMLVSVTERTKEIGLRRAMGATQRDILRQFLSESLLQCVAGGIAGIGLGFVCALALRTFTSFPASVQGWVVVLGVLISSVLGLFFGIYPAVQASRLDPVVALRAE